LRKKILEEERRSWLMSKKVGQFSLPKGAAKQRKTSHRE
jgi:hypothetical protein